MGAMQISTTKKVPYRSHSGSANLTTNEPENQIRPAEPVADTSVGSITITRLQEIANALSLELADIPNIKEMAKETLRPVEGENVFYDTMAERSSYANFMEHEAGLADRHLKRRDTIEDALAHINEAIRILEEGRPEPLPYTGLCCKCNKPISTARLTIAPETNVCSDCAKELEKRLAR